MDAIISIVLSALGVLAVLIALFVRWLTKASSRKVESLDAKVSELESRVKRLEALPRAAAASIVATAVTATIPSPAPAPTAVSVPTPSAKLVEREPATVKFESELPPATPTGPSILDQAKAWLFGGNTVARFGLLILFLGLSFLAKYAVDNDLFPIEARLALIGGIAVGLLVVGWRLRESRPGYGLLLQGGAIAVLYLEIFAGYKFYGLLPGVATFGLMMVVCALATFLSLRQNAMVLALVASVGGFLTPILTSSGGGNFAGLFSIYAILNIGIFAIARFKSWRLLYLAGFVLTFGIATMWALERYTPKDFSLAIGFIVFFIALYSLIPILEARRAVPNIKHYVDGTLVFGTPTVGFGLLVKLVAHWEYGAAFAALGLGAWYIAVAALGLKKHVNSAVTANAGLQPPSLAFANDSVQGLKSAFVSYVALGAGFASLAIPLALDPRLAGIAWAVEGAALIWLGVRTSQALTRLSGVLLQALGFGIFMTRGFDTVHDKAFLNSFWMGAMMLAIAMYASAWLYRQRFARQSAATANQTPQNKFVLKWQSIESLLSSGFLIIASALAFMSTSNELVLLVLNQSEFAVMLAFCTIFSFVYAWLGKRLAWPLLVSIASLLLPVQVFLMFLQWIGFSASFAQWRWVVWPLSAIAMIWVLRWRRPTKNTGRAFAVHALTMALLSAQLIQWSVRYVVSDEAWAIAGVGALLSGLLLLSSRFSSERLGVWLRHAVQADAYRTLVPRGLAWLVGMWFVFACISDYGGTAITPYIPLLNPVDLSASFALLCLFAFSRAESFTALQIESKYSQLAMAAAAFLLLNTLLMRALSHYLELAYSAQAMMDSAPAQTAFSLLWAATATVVMFVASRKSIRSAWVVGAALLGIVVVKLFLVDLSTISALTRIVSFVGVGLLMLLIGYLSPLPPARVSGNFATKTTAKNSEKL
jgi:uncharacterized membrane protein